MYTGMAVSRYQRIQHVRRSRIPRHVKARLGPVEVRALLKDLGDMGCFLRLSPLEIDRLETSPPEDSDEFTDVVLVADGFLLPVKDPIGNQVREVVARAFTRVSQSGKVSICTPPLEKRPL